jgi:hypothetical protein
MQDNDTLQTSRRLASEFVHIQDRFAKVKVTSEMNAPREMYSSRRDSPTSRYQYIDAARNAVDGYLHCSRAPRPLAAMKVDDRRASHCRNGQVPWNRQSLRQPQFPSEECDGHPLNWIRPVS